MIGRTRAQLLRKKDVKKRSCLSKSQRTSFKNKRPKDLHENSHQLLLLHCYLPGCKHREKKDIQLRIQGNQVVYLTNKELWCPWSRDLVANLINRNARGPGSNPSFFPMFFFFSCGKKWQGKLRTCRSDIVWSQRTQIKIQ